MHKFETRYYNPRYTKHSRKTIKWRKTKSCWVTIWKDNIWILKSRAWLVHRRVGLNLLLEKESSAPGKQGARSPKQEKWITVSNILQNTLSGCRVTTTRIWPYFFTWGSGFGELAFKVASLPTFLPPDAVPFAQGKAHFRHLNLEPQLRGVELINHDGHPTML